MLSRLERAFLAQIAAFPGWHLPLAAGRTIIALAQISILLFTPAAALFVPIANGQAESPCIRPLLAISPYCWFPDDRQLVSTVVIVVLLWVASGFLPQVTGFVHAWLSFSFAQTISLPDGGDYVAQVTTLFLAFVSIGHRRWWYWQRSPAASPRALNVPMAVGAMWAVRAQVAWIYLNSGLSKVSVSEWQEGSAIYYVARMEWFGASGPIGDLFLWATSMPAVALAISWGTIIGECAIAVFILLPGRWPAVAFAISAALHLAIIVAIGLFSFGWIMIGAVMSAAAPALSTFLPSSPPTELTQTTDDELAESRTGV
ncbi:hypothetical protein HWD99_17395 [Microbacterium sp. C5A9]|uniref:hypothetical protein n=1 Tax=Microbacterium sp. C5A9 TaxID=2736663 RepID=UPI001F52866A|nr:hypothetical protein [Microbacterium sp. C5A9]MCI1020404.1 hypothetical protein [Microbacterium sp. C5A9]